MSESTPDYGGELARFLSRVEEGAALGHEHVTLLGLQPSTLPKLLEKVRRGVSYSAWQRFLRNTGLEAAELGALLGIPPRTLSRRKREGRFSAQESDRLLRISRLFALALALFEGDAAATRRWLGAPQGALGDATPLELASSELGAREVEALIGRLEFGLPA